MTAAAGGLAVWGPLVAAAAVVAVDGVVTGGLHLDAVADVGDVAGSRRRGTAALEVARDPAIGALGAVSLAVTLLLRFALLAHLLTGPPAVSPGGWLLAGVPGALAAVPMVGRTALVAALAWWRGGGGPPSSVDGLARSAGPGVLTLTLVTTVAVLLLLGVGPLPTVAIVAGSALTVSGLVLWWRARVGAASGDLVGATGVAAELVALATLGVTA